MVTRFHEDRAGVPTTRRELVATHFLAAAIASTTASGFPSIQATSYRNDPLRVPLGLRYNVGTTDAYILLRSPEGSDPPASEIAFFVVFDGEENVRETRRRVSSYLRSLRGEEVVGKNEVAIWAATTTAEHAIRESIVTGDQALVPGISTTNGDLLPLPVTGYEGIDPRDSIGALSGEIWAPAGDSADARIRKWFVAPSAPHVAQPRFIPFMDDLDIRGRVFGRSLPDPLDIRAAIDGPPPTGPSRTNRTFLVCVRSSFRALWRLIRGWFVWPWTRPRH